MARRESAVARGVSNMLPVFITAAGGGVLVDAVRGDHGTGGPGLDAREHSESRNYKKEAGYCEPEASWHVPPREL